MGENGIKYKRIINFLVSHPDQWWTSKQVGEFLKDIKPIGSTLSRIAQRLWRNRVLEKWIGVPLETRR